MKIGISAIEYYLPEKILTNDYFKYAKSEFLEEKVGIKQRHIAAENEATSDLAVKAINKLIKNNNINRSEIEFLVFCSLTPDHLLPQTSAQVQAMCELPTSLNSFDIRMGCSGFVQSLALAQCLIMGMGYKKGLVVAAEKFSTYLSYRDYNVDTLFSDSGAAVLVEKDPKLFEIISHDFGTDGTGAEHIIIPAGGSREPITEESSKFTFIKEGVERARRYLYMNGRQVMKFADKTVPGSADRTLKRGGVKLEDLDWVVMHQANKLMLENLGEIMHIPKEKNYINLWNKGNTTSPSIAIAIKELLDKGERLNHGGYWLITGFGVGFAWGTTLLKYVGK